MEKIQINLEILLPEIPDERDACVERLISVMQKQKGIANAHLIPEGKGNSAKLCFHYNPDLISIERVEKFAKDAGAKITDQYSHLLIEVVSIREMMEAEVREHQLKKLPGVSDVSVSATGNIRLEFDQTKTDKQQKLPGKSPTRRRKNTNIKKKMNIDMATKIMTTNTSMSMALKVQHGRLICLLSPVL